MPALADDIALHVTIGDGSHLLLTPGEPVRWC
jgi:hypothetical protein